MEGQAIRHFATYTGGVAIGVMLVSATLSWSQTYVDFSSKPNVNRGLQVNSAAKKIESQIVPNYATADVPIVADDFNTGTLDLNKWLLGTNAGNQAAVVSNALQLRAQNSAYESGWVVTRNAYPARNLTVAVKVVQPNNDGDLGISPTYNASSIYGIYNEPNFYRFYTYRNSASGPYFLYVEWKKNGVLNGFDVTGNFVITGAVYLRLRGDDTKIHFEASLDGVTWTDTYNETFALPGYTLDTPFYYELAGYKTWSLGTFIVDDFSITSQSSDTQPPVISAVTAQNITSSSAQITWQTDELADSQVEYGLTASYGNTTPLDGSFVLAHSITLPSLQPNTTYHYRVKSKDLAGNLALSGDLIFTTTSSSRQFTDITASAGVAGISDFGGHGIIFADVNGDALVDMYVTHTNFVPGSFTDFLVLPDELFINNGNNTFTERAAIAGVNDPGQSHGAVFVDFDNDGDFDLFNGQRGPSGNRLYRNNGDGNFTDVTSAAGILLADRRTIGVLAVDIDNDGDMDLFSANWGVTNEMYINNGAGSFTVEERGVTDIDADPNGTVAAVAADVDNDGDMDIFMTKRVSQGVDACKLYINDGRGYFTDQASSRGVAFSGLANGVVFIDFDRNGDLDMLLAESALDLVDEPNTKLHFYRNQGNGFFTDETSLHNIPHSGYTVNAGDVDNDGDPDIFVYMNHGAGSVWLNDGTGHFVKHSSAGFDHIADDVRAGTFADIDNDGDLDVAFTEINAYTSLYRNELNGSATPAQNYLQIILTGSNGRVGLFGSKFYLYEAGHLDDPAFLLSYQQLTSSLGTLSQNSPIVHFGVSPAKNYDLRVKLLGGSSIVRLNLAPGQRLPVQTGSDVTPPTISNVTAGNLTVSSANITWTTNELADSQVEYGLTTSYGSSSPLNTALVTTHTVPLASLQANSTYHYRVKSKDAAGNLATSGDFTFATLQTDVTPPLISNVAASNITISSATIGWTTNESSDSQVEYGLTTSYGSSSPLNTTLVTAHSVPLASLQANTTYHYRVKSKDAAGNLATSGDFTFVTLQTDVTPPLISNVAASNITTSSVSIGWTTNEAADSQVEYGLTTSYGSSSPLNTALVTTHTVPLASLQANTTYHYRVKSKDAAGNLATSGDFTFVTLQTDVTPPLISNVAASNITISSATIGWTTNESSDSQVEYGLTTNYGSSSPLNSSLVISHTVALSSLQANTIYHYRVKSKDATGNLGTSGDFTFTTLALPSIIFADDFNTSSLNTSKWFLGTNAANQSAVANNALELRSQSYESGWVLTRQAFAARNTAITVKVLQPNYDGDLGISPTYTLSSIYGIYNEPTWYRFYTFPSGQSGVYHLYVEWKKNGVIDGQDVTGNLLITGTIYLRLRLDNSHIHFEASFEGANWTDTYNEPFSLPGYTLDNNFYYELAAYKTWDRGVLIVDDFSITNVALPPDTQPPQISALAAQNVSGSSAEIIWQTNEPADSQVEYGLTTSYGSLSPLNTALVTAHTEALASLQANTTYHYRVKSKDAAGNLATSGDFTFITSSSVLPLISSFSPTSGPVGTQVTIAGSNFTGATSVAFNGTAATGFTVISASQIQVNVPADATTGKISITTTAGTATSVNDFTVITILTFGPTDDAYVQSSNPTRNYGTSSQLQVRKTSSNQINAYLKFNVTGLSGNVQSAKLRLYVTDAGSDGGAIYSVSNNYLGTSTPWLESGLRWNNAPAISGNPLAAVGAVSVGQTVELDVTAAINGNGVYSLAISNNSSNTVQYRSKQGVNPPVLVIQTGAAAVALAEMTEAGTAAKKASFVALATEIPDRFVLYPSFPNPLRLSAYGATTSLAYQLPERTHVKLTLYDVLGHEINVLVDRTHEAGTYAVRWNGRDALGRILPAGTYFYRLQASGFSSVKKLLLVK